MRHIWNILSYMLFYALWGPILGLGLGSLPVLAGLGILSYGINLYTLRKLKLPEQQIIAVKKRFFVFEWKQYYVNLFFTIFLSFAICMPVYWIFYSEYPLDWRYIAGCWLFIYMNTNNVYEIRICKENVDVELLDQLRENRLTFRIHFVKEDEEKLVCYTTLGGMKRLSQKKHNNFHHV